MPRNRENESRRTRSHRRSSTEIDAILEEYGRSQLTQVEFAKSQDVALSTLTNWLRRRRKEDLAGSASQGFVEVTVKESGGFCSGELMPPFELILGDGGGGKRIVESVRLSGGFDSGDLERLLGDEQAPEASGVSRAGRKQQNNEERNPVQRDSCPGATKFQKLEALTPRYPNKLQKKTSLVTW